MGGKSKQLGHYGCDNTILWKPFGRNHKGAVIKASIPIKKVTVIAFFESFNDAIAADGEATVGHACIVNLIIPIITLLGPLTYSVTASHELTCSHITFVHNNFRNLPGTGGRDISAARPVLGRCGVALLIIGCSSNPVGTEDLNDPISTIFDTTEFATSITVGRDRGSPFLGTHLHIFRT